MNLNNTALFLEQFIPENFNILLRIVHKNWNLYIFSGLKFRVYFTEDVKERQTFIQDILEPEFL